MEPLVSIYEVPGDDSVVLSPESVADRFEGYYLDGEFVAPQINPGCDMVMCSQITASPSVSLIAHDLDRTIATA